MVSDDGNRHFVIADNGKLSFMMENDRNRYFMVADGRKSNFFYGG